MSISVVWRASSAIDILLARVTRSIGSLKTTKKPSAPTMSLDEFFACTKTRAPEILIELPRELAFHDTFVAPVSSRKDLKALFENELAKTSPLIDEVSVLPLHGSERSALTAVHIRKRSQIEIEKHAQKLGLQKVSICCEDAPNCAFDLPLYVQQTLLSRKLCAIAFALSIAGIWLGVSTVAEKRSYLADQWESRSNNLRKEVLIHNSASKEAQAYDALAARHPRSTSPQGVLQRLAALTEATPKSTHWTEISIHHNAILLSAISDDAGASLTELSSSMPGKTIQFSGSVSELRDSTQSFTVEIKETSHE